MENVEEKPFLPLQLSAALLAVVVAVLGLVAWFELKLWAMHLWSEMSISFMPLVLGLAAGLVVRLCTHQDSFGLAGFVAALTVLASLAGMAMQSRLEIEHRLDRFAAVAYDETRDYAERTAYLTNDEALRCAFTNSEVAVIGRLAHQVKAPTPEQYWRVRNLFHLHWIASRQLVVCGESGVDHTIWEATQVEGHMPFMHQVVTALADQPVSDEDLARFKTWEQPYLQRIAANYINRQQFEGDLIHMANGELTWNLLAFHGIGPIIGSFTLLGALAGFNLVRRRYETELV